MPPTSPKAQRPKGWKRRVAKACDSCRRKRIKCCGARPACTQCTSASLTCRYSDHLNDRASHQSDSGRSRSNIRKPRGTSSLNNDPSANTNSENARRDSVGHETSAAPARNSESVTPPANDSTRRATMVAENTGELRYFGPSSNMSVLTPDGLQWIESRTADVSLRQRLEMPLQGGGSWAGWTHPMLQSLWPATLSTPLPPWEETLSLITEYLENYNTILPIFHPPTLMGQLGRQYARSVNAVEDPTLSVALNAILAVALRSRAQDDSNNQELTDRSWACAKNSLESVLAILMRSVSLLSVQALLVLAFFFQGTPNPQPFFFLTSAAVRLSHSAGLHRTFDHLPLSEVDREQRRRVFWIALILDSKASTRCGRPLVQHIDDIGIPTPLDSPKDNMGILVNRDGTAVLNMLNAETRFYVIGAKIYQSVFTASSSEKSIGALTADTHNLGEELEDWRRVALRGVEMDTISDKWGQKLTAVISLLLSYHSSIITVYSATWQRLFSSMRGLVSGQRELDRSATNFPNTEKCLHAAHEIIKITKLIPKENHAFSWTIVHCPMQALMLIFICILQQPCDPSVEARLQAINDAMEFISQLSSTQEGSFLGPVLSVCRELSRIARLAIQRGLVRTNNVTPAGDEESAVLNPQAIENLMMNFANSNQPSATQGYQSNMQFVPPNMANVPPPDVNGAWPQDTDGANLTMHQLYGLPLPFTWNWQDLSNGLLEDFDFS